MINLATSRRSGEARPTLAAAVVAAVGAVLALSACGSAAQGPGGGTPTAEPTASPRHTTATAAADCSAKAILSALPGGATMEKFECAKVGGTEWAAARVAPGPTVFFLQWHGTAWRGEDSDSVCGTASAGLPSSLLSYCTATTPSSLRPSPTRTPSRRPTTPPTPTTAACTSKAIRAALPSAATLEKFTCAEVGGKPWAAARVKEGSTVFFLQWNGSRWDAQDSDGICGTASAGLPQSLLSYCK